MMKFFFGTLLAVVISAQAHAADIVEQGRYQSVLGDCEGCHTADPQKPFAGGVSLLTPFGKLVTPNITPDKQTGIGSWDLEDFRHAMTRGVGRGGKLLYPAMPYPSYAHMDDRDIDALWAYLRTIKPVRNRIWVNQLRFPFNERIVMRAWNLLYFRPQPYVPNPNKSASWNRGAYLVSGPGHCGTCHTPKSFAGSDTGHALSGGLLEGWFAPDLSGDRMTGLGSWSVTDVVEYLQTGRNSLSIASGPMAEAVENSTAKMHPADLNAIAVYLKDLPPVKSQNQSQPPMIAQMNRGARLYRIDCEACHGSNGRGNRILFPPLAGNANVMQSGPETLVRVVLAGVRGASTAKAPTAPAMPSFAWKLNDQQVADILTYIRNNWGNSAPAVQTQTVATLRASLD